MSADNLTSDIVKFSSFMSVCCGETDTDSRKGKKEVYYKSTFVESVTVLTCEVTFEPFPTGYQARWTLCNILCAGTVQAVLNKVFGS